MQAHEARHAADIEHSMGMPGQGRLLIMRLTLIISAISLGGSERVLTTMANYWATKGWPITLLTLDDGMVSPSYSLHPHITHIPLSLTGTSNNFIQAAMRNFRRVKVLRKAIHKSDSEAVISFLECTNILTILASIGYHKPVIISERIDTANYDIGPIWEFLRRRTYPTAAALVVQTEPALTRFSSSMRRRGRVIPNPVIGPSEGNCPGQVDPSLNRREKVVAMGRLVRQKGFDLLINAWKEIAHIHQDWKLEIWGEGPERLALEQLRDRYGLCQQVEFPGITAYPLKVFSESSIFVLSSRFEGFPNVLCEAMACGLPAISFDCSSGPGYIVRDGIDGVLVPDGDIKSLSDAIDRLVRNPEERLRLGNAARNVVDKYGLDKVMRMWEELLEEVVRK